MALKIGAFILASCNLISASIFDAQIFGVATAPANFKAYAPQQALELGHQLPLGEHAPALGNIILKQAHHDDDQRDHVVADKPRYKARDSKHGYKKHGDDDQSHSDTDSKHGDDKHDDQSHGEEDSGHGDKKHGDKKRYASPKGKVDVVKVVVAKPNVVVARPAVVVARPAVVVARPNVVVNTYQIKGQAAVPRSHIDTNEINVNHVPVNFQANKYVEDHRPLQRPPITVVNVPAIETVDTVQHHVATNENINKSNTPGVKDRKNKLANQLLFEYNNLSSTEIRKVRSERVKSAEKVEPADRIPYVHPGKLEYKGLVQQAVGDARLNAPIIVTNFVASNKKHYDNDDCQDGHHDNYERDHHDEKKGYRLNGHN